MEYFQGILFQVKQHQQPQFRATGKSLSLVSWHIFTIFLLVGAVSFFLVGFSLLLPIALYPLIAINALGALLFILLAVGSHKELRKMPGAVLMTATAVCGYLGAAWLA